MKRLRNAGNRMSGEWMMGLRNGTYPIRRYEDTSPRGGSVRSFVVQAKPPNNQDSR